MARRRSIGIGIIAACATLLSAIPATAFAGPIGVISTLIMLLYVAIAIAIGLALLGLVLARYITDPQQRAIARLSIVLFVATPVPIAASNGTSSFLPALAVVLTSWTHAGPHAYVLLTAYAISFAMFVPLVLIWFRLGERYRVRR